MSSSFLLFLQLSMAPRKEDTLGISPFVGLWLNCVHRCPTFFSSSWSAVAVPPDCNEAHIFSTLVQYAPNLSLSPFRPLLCNTEIQALSPDVATVMHELSPGVKIGVLRCMCPPWSAFRPHLYFIRGTTWKIGASSALLVSYASAVSTRAM